MKSIDFYERSYATDAGGHLSHCQEWTERIFMHLDVLSKRPHTMGLPLLLSIVDGSA
jgi:hypothetical protein